MTAILLLLLAQSLPDSHVIRFAPACRLFDSRTDVVRTFQNVPDGVRRVRANETISVQVAGKCDIPKDASAVALNITVVPKGLLGYITVWSGWGPRPTVSLLNALDGALKSNSTLVELSDGNIAIYASNETDVIVDLQGGYAVRALQYFFGDAIMRTTAGNRVQVVCDQTAFLKSAMR